MDFIDTETQTLLRDTANRLVRSKYDFEARKKHVASPQGWSSAMWKEFAELGLLGVDASEEQGGSGGTFADLAVVLESFGRGLVIEPYFSSNVLGAAVLRAAGGHDDILSQVAAGQARLALAYAEPAGRFNAAHVATSARADGKGWRLDGHKAVVLGAQDADTIIVSARTSGQTGDARGISLFLIPRQANGVTIRPYRLMDDRNAADVILENVEASALAGGADNGLPLLEAALDRGTAALCCEAVGAMDAVNDLTLEYIKTRQQFGRPIGKFQVLQHRMADMMLAAQSARSMMYLAIANADNPDPQIRARTISAAKVQIGKNGTEVGRGAIQLHGGIGMTEEYVAAHYFRRLTAIEKLLGDTDFHIDRFAALS